MNAEQGKDKRNRNRLRQWAAILAVPLFLAGTALFSFLWNVPLDKLAVPRKADSPPVVLFNEPSSPAVRAIPGDPSLQPVVLSLLQHYAETVSNAGHLDFSGYAPQEVEIRMDGLSIGLSPSLAVFNFRTKYGFSMQTSKKPDATDRAVYQWLKNMMQAEEPEKPGGRLTQPSNRTDAALSNPSSSRKSCGTAGSSVQGIIVPAPEDDSIHRL